MFIIPDHVLESAHISEQELGIEIAALLYSMDKLSFGQAKALAGINGLEFQKVLNEKGIPLHYSITDFENDLLSIEKLNVQ